MNTRIGTSSRKPWGHIVVRMGRITAAVLAVVGEAWSARGRVDRLRRNRLKVSDPAEHEQLSIRPGWVSLAFDRTVKSRC